MESRVSYSGWKDLFVQGKGASPICPAASNGQSRPEISDNAPGLKRKQEFLFLEEFPQAMNDSRGLLFHAIV